MHFRTINVKSETGSVPRSGPELITLFPRSTQQGIQFILLLLLIVKNCWHLNIYEQDNLTRCENTGLRAVQAQKIAIGLKFRI